MRRLTLTGCIALAVASTSLHAQGARALVSQAPVASTAEPPRPLGDRTSPRARPGGERATVLSYDAAQSRGLFASCDDNADDRLDLFETRQALQDLGDPSSPNWYRRLDTDRDGFLEWPEFDRFYRDLIRDGGTLHLWLARPMQAVSGPTATAGRVAPSRTIDLFDSDHDGMLDLPETQAMLAALGVAPNLISMAPMLDRNRDGKLSPEELAPAMQQLGIDLFAAPAGAQNQRAGAALAEPWRAIDRDGNQTIDARELASALRRIDPQLERWADRILAGADRNGDARLGANELPTAAAATTPGPATAQGMAERSGKR